MITPKFIGQIYRNTANGDVWQANSLTPGDWTKIAGTGGGGTNLDAAGDPTGVTTPDYVGQYYRDTSTGNIWKSTGATSADWTLQVQDMQVIWTPTTDKLGEAIGFISQGDLAGITSISFLGTTGIGGVDIEYWSDLTSISFPNLTSYDPLGIGNYGFDFIGCPKLKTISAPLLNLLNYGISVKNNALLDTVDIHSLSSIIGGGDLWLQGNPSLATVNLDSLQSVGGGLYVLNSALTSLSLPNLTTVTSVNVTSPVLTSFIAPNWIPTDGQSVNFVGCALSATAVEHILRRLVLAGVSSCSIDLSGGTNAGLASLSAQGQADATALGAQLTINP